MKQTELSESIRKIVSFTSISFEERESKMFEGLLIYLRNSIGDYLPQEKIVSFALSLKNLRNRPADMGFSNELCEVLSMESKLSNRYIPRKSLRKDEAALLIYNLAPYALLSRRETAMMTKRLFPNFFGTVETINASFTKLYASNGKLIDTPRTISIEVMPDHTTYTIERVFLELGSMLNVNKS